MRNDGNFYHFGEEKRTLNNGFGVDIRRIFYFTVLYFMYKGKANKHLNYINTQRKNLNERYKSYITRKYLCILQASMEKLAL